MKTTRCGKGVVCLWVGVGLALAACGGRVATVDTEFLKDLIRIPSVSADVAEVNRVADFTRRYAESRGLYCQVETNAAGRCMMWVANVGGKRPDVLLSAHLDVVPAQTPDLFFPREADGRIYGRGASDCKEHVALSMHLMERLAGKVSIGAIFGTDARHLQYLNLSMLIIGVDARGAHSPAEHVKIASLGEYADLLAGFLTERYR